MANRPIDTARRVWGIRPVRAAIIVVTLLALGFGLLVGSSLLPAERINAQIGKASATLTAEGTYPQQSYLGSTFQRDNYTDAIMLNMSMIYGPAPIKTTLSALYYDNEAHDPVSSLADRVESGVQPNNPYIRYWQGYVPFVRLAMLVVDYATWRVVNAVLLIGLSLAALALTWRRVGRGAAVALLVALSVTAPPVVFNSLQFSSVFYVALSGIIAALYLADRYPHKRFDLELFAVLGAVTAYLDFLTAPLLTLGLPLLVLLAYRRAHEVDDQPAGRGADGGVWWPLRAIPAWGVGYVGFWAVRWVYNVVAINPKAFTDISGAISQRAGSGMALSDRFSVVLQNLYLAFPRQLFADPPTLESVTSVVVFAVALYVVAWAALFFLSANGGGRYLFGHSAPLLVVASLPFGWMLFAANHSGNHYFMVYRILAVATFALGLFLVQSIYWPNLFGGLAPAKAGGTKSGGTKSGGRAASGKVSSKASGKASAPASGKAKAKKRAK